MKICFCEGHAEDRGNYHTAWSIGFSAQFPDGKIFRERDFCRFSDDASENTWRHSFAGNLITRSLCEGACIFHEGMECFLVNLSSNFNRTTLHYMCFPVCLLHDGPNFQGHLC